MAAVFINGRIVAFLVILSGITIVQGWDSIDLELFDLVEEIKENFYDVLGVSKVYLKAIQ